MSAVLNILTENGAMLLAGVTALLLAGSLIAVLSSSPVHRQRVCEISIVSTITWVVLAVIPFPRLAWQSPAPTLPKPVDHVSAIATPLIEIPRELIVGAHEIRNQNIASDASPFPAGSPPRPIFGRTILVQIYLAGAVICAVWLLLGHLLLWRLIRKATPAPADVLAMLDVGSSGMTPHLPRILIAAKLSRPVTCGVFWPVILLPESLLQADRRCQLRQAVLHEMGHIQQRDSVGNLLFILAMPLFYFHPFYWLLRRFNYLARELVADDLAAQSDGKEAYVSQLIELARSRNDFSFNPVVAIGILQSRSHFYRRMQMLLHRNQPLATRCSTLCRSVMILLTFALVVALAGTFGVKRVSAQPLPAEQASGNKTEAGGQDPQIDPEELKRREDALWKSYQKQLILVNGEPTNLKEVQAKFEIDRAKLREQMKSEAAQNRSKDQVIKDRIGLNNRSIDDLLAQRHRLRADLEAYKSTLGPDHPKSKQAQAELNDCLKQIQAYTQGQRDLQEKAINDLSDNQIGMLDQYMRKLLEDRDDARFNYDKFKDQVTPENAGLPENAPVHQLESRYKAAQKRVDEYAAEWRDKQHKLGERGMFRQVAPMANDAARIPSAVDSTHMGGMQLDLIQLGNSLVDASGAVQIAKVKYQAASAVLKDGGQNALDMMTAHVNLEVAQKRLTLLLGIAEVALKNAQDELSIGMQRYRNGLQTEQGLSELKSKVQMLELIINAAK